MLYENCNDNELWACVQKDDQAAFDHLYHRHVQVIFATLYRHCESRQDAEDLTQEVFLVLWEKRAQIVIEGKLFSYLYRVARNRALKYLKARSLSPKALETFNQLLEETLPVASEAFREKERTEMEKALTGTIDALPARMKEIFHLSHVKGMSISQIAEQLLVSPQTVKNQLATVRKRIKGTYSRFILVIAGLMLWLATSR